MGKRELKKQYKELGGFIDVISLLDTTPSKKLTPFLVQQFNSWANEDQKSSPKHEIIVSEWLEPKMGVIKKFTEHMVNNRLVEKDINKYDSWESIELAINEVGIKQSIKDKESHIITLHQDEEWFIVKPLTMESSVKHGYGTKWCTAMRDCDNHFHKYSKEGVLISVINRNNGVKYLFYSSPKEYSVWTTVDKLIDPKDTTIPNVLLDKLRGWTDFSKVGPNYDYFNEEDKKDVIDGPSRVTLDGEVPSDGYTVKVDMKTLIKVTTQRLKVDLKRLMKKIIYNKTN